MFKSILAGLAAALIASVSIALAQTATVSPVQPPVASAATPDIVISTGSGPGQITIGTTSPASSSTSTSTYAITGTDATKTIDRTYSAGAMTDTLANVSASGMGAGFSTTVCADSPQQINLSVNSPSTIWTGTGAVTSLVIAPDTCIGIKDPQGNNYVAFQVGGISSAALTTPPWLTVTGSPLTGSGGTLAVTATSEPANQVIASPNGSSGASVSRALVYADLPSVTGPALIGRQTATLGAVSAPYAVSNTTDSTIPAVHGTITTGHCADFSDTTGTLTDAGTTCGGGGGSTSVISGNDVTVSGSPCTTSCTVNVKVQSGVTAAAYTNPSVTVDAQGIVTAIANGSSSGNPATVNVYDTPGTFTWTWSAAYTHVYVIVCGPGGPGGSGGTNTGVSSAGAGGGVPGSGGECAANLFRASDVAASQTVTVAAGGTGGGSVTSATPALGNPGIVSSPCDSSFGSLLIGHCGAPGVGGPDASGSIFGGSGGCFTGDGTQAVAASSYNGTAGQGANGTAFSSVTLSRDSQCGAGSVGSTSTEWGTTPPASVSYSRNGGNGGGPGGPLSASTSSNGGPGLIAFASTAAVAGGTSGTPAGADGVNGTYPCEPGSSGAGGYGNFAGAGGHGGVGGRAAGGGSGGAAILSSATGAGGAGGHGCVYVAAW